MLEPYRATHALYSSEGATRARRTDSARASFAHYTFANKEFALFGDHSAGSRAGLMIRLIAE